MTDAQHIYEAWHTAAKNRDTAALIALYHDDAEFESPLVPIIMARDSGVLRGRAEIEAFLAEGTRRRPNELVRWYRDGRYLANAGRRTSRYPRTDGTGGRQNPPAPHLLGLVRHTNADSLGAGEAGMTNIHTP